MPVDAPVTRIVLPFKANNSTSLKSYVVMLIEYAICLSYVSLERVGWIWL